MYHRHYKFVVPSFYVVLDITEINKNPLFIKFRVIRELKNKILDEKRVPMNTTTRLVINYVVCRWELQWLIKNKCYHSILTVSKALNEFSAFISISGELLKIPRASV